MRRERRTAPPRGRREITRGARSVTRSPVTAFVSTHAGHGARWRRGLQRRLPPVATGPSSRSPARRRAKGPRRYELRGPFEGQPPGPGAHNADRATGTGDTPGRSSRLLRSRRPCHPATAAPRPSSSLGQRRTDHRLRPIPHPPWGVRGRSSRAPNPSPTRGSGELSRRTPVSGGSSTTGTPVVHRSRPTVHRSRLRVWTNGLRAAASMPPPGLGCHVAGPARVCDQRTGRPIMGREQREKGPCRYELQGPFGRSATRTESA